MNNTCIVVCGQKFDIGTRVVLWDELGGLNGYDTTKYVYKDQNRKTGKVMKRSVSGRRFSKRSMLAERTMVSLRKLVTQFFLHHDGLYRASTTYHVLHVERGLSVHFILDDDGTIYQTLDLFEKAWHGGNCNPMSVGIEISSRAAAGRFPDAYDETHQKKYRVGPRKKHYDVIHNHRVIGYEYNDNQYEALIRLGIRLVELFPLLGGFNGVDFPRDPEGHIIKDVIVKPKKHRGFICHYNNSKSKIDPIAFDHDRFQIGVQDRNPWMFSTFDDFVNEPLDTWLERQQSLLFLGYSPGPIDGIFGKKTKVALMSFQKNHGLVADGIWGPMTQNAIMDLIEEV